MSAVLPPELANMTVGYFDGDGFDERQGPLLRSSTISIYDPFKSVNLRSLSAATLSLRSYGSSNVNAVDLPPDDHLRAYGIFVG